MIDEHRSACAEQYIRTGPAARELCLMCARACLTLTKKVTAVPDSATLQLPRIITRNVVRNTTGN
jgi:hypothetical protein